MPESMAGPTLRSDTGILQYQTGNSFPASPNAIRAYMRYGDSFLVPSFPTHYGTTSAARDSSRVQYVTRELHDPWFSFDKLQHFTFSFLFTVGGQYTFKNKIGFSKNEALPYAIGSAWLVGVLKELYDWQLGPRRYFSKKDMVANSVGILSATAFILLW